MQTYLLYQHGKVGNISKDFTISYGACRHSDYHERIHAFKLEDAKDELEQMKVREQLKKEMTLADMEYAKKEIKRVSSI